MIDHQIDQFSFGFYEDEQIRNISVLQIDNPIIYENLGKNIFAAGGVYDKRLGMISKFQKELCVKFFFIILLIIYFFHHKATCGGNWFQCIGHYGHIELSQPVFNPLIFEFLKKILSVTCWHCHKFPFSSSQVCVLNFFDSFFLTFV